MDYRSEIKNLRGKYLRGELTMEQAEKLATPLVNEMNAKGEAIAKKFGKKYKPLKFKYMIR